MTNPTDTLREEHEHILRALDVLDAAARRIGDGRPPAPSRLEALGEFLAEFADRCHHAKEEEQLFPAMEQAGVPREQGPISVMLAEHEEGRGYVAQMRAAATELIQGDAGGADRWADAAAAFAGLLRDHIFKENEVLFPMADQVIPPDAMEVLERGFDDAQARFGADAIARLLALLEESAADLGV